MNKIKKLLSIGVFLVFLSSLAAANGLNLNSIGSRALSMGGAFVGLADDFSAAYWNPAGMAQFSKKTFGFYASDVIPSMTYKFDMFGMSLVNAKTNSKNYFTGMAAYYFPINDKLVAGISAYVPSGLGASWNGADFSMISAMKTYKWESRIGMFTFAPGLAYKVSDKFMVGATLNVNYGTFDLSTHAGVADLGVMDFDTGQQTINFTGWGYGATFGILVKPADQFSFGITLRTPSKIKFKGTTEISNFSTMGQLIGLPLSSTSDTDVELTWPMWLAFGIAYKPMQKLTLTADVQYTNWKKVDVMTLNFQEAAWQIMMVPSGDNVFPLHWKNATQIRFGGEYWVSNQLALRAGYYIDPAPAPDSTMNVLLPNFDFNVITFGLGYVTNGLELNFGFEYLMGKDRNIAIDMSGEQESMPGVYTMKIIVPTVSIGYGW